MSFVVHGGYIICPRSLFVVSGVSFPSLLSSHHLLQSSTDMVHSYSVLYWICVCLVICDFDDRYISLPIKLELVKTITYDRQVWTGKQD